GERTGNVAHPRKGGEGIAGGVNRLAPVRRTGQGMIKPDAATHLFDPRSNNKEGSMMLQFLPGVFAILVLTPPSQPASDQPPADYAELSKLIHKAVVKEIPKEYVNASEWGKTIPIPAKLRLPNLRTKVKVGDHDELSHGLWQKIRVWLAETVRVVTFQ